MNDVDAASGDEFVQQLVELIQAIEASGYAVLPRTDQELLESVVEAAASILNAKAASIALVDESAGELEFKVSFDQTGGHSVIGMRFPINQGIAGHVAMTGQPMAVSSVQDDSRFNQDFAENTGYVPSAILAVPLLLQEKVIGVMEVLDKNSAASFSLQDMDLLTIFARQAAIAIDQAQLHNQLGTALTQGLLRLVENSGADGTRQLLENLSATSQQAPSDLHEIAVLLSDIASGGSAERRACIQILEVFSQYGHRKNRFL
ncbi:MAG TPA: GAF domain-containing protein [candidate division Zixibacteria bacterium]|nr:GAF domain-containing protein [candidate division Zixibacteria bacterium]